MKRLFSVCNAGSRAWRWTARSLVLAVALGGITSGAIAGDVTIVDAKATQQSPGVWRFSVTLEHADTGWEHYADRWDVMTPDGTLLGTRTLYHPHVNEQPFTRSLGGVKIPASVTSVMIRARDSKHGFAEKRFTVDLSAPKS